MPKVTLPDITSGYVSGDAMSTAFNTIEQAFENTLSRDGTLPNAMESDIDMGSHRLLNLPEPASDGEPVTLGTFRRESTGYVVQTVETQVAAVGQTVFTLVTMNYQPGTNNLAVFVNGLRKFAGSHYTETDTQHVTFLTPMAGTEQVVFVSNEFYGSLEFPVVPIVPWGNITGIPDFASRWPTYNEVTGKPSTFTPSAHQHDTADITTGVGLADPRRGVWVQPSAPTATRVGDLWFD